MFVHLRCCCCSPFAVLWWSLQLWCPVRGDAEQEGGAEAHGVLTLGEVSSTSGAMCRCQIRTPIWTPLEEVWIPQGAETLTWPLDFCVCWRCGRAARQQMGKKEPCPAGFIPLQEPVLNSCRRCELVRCLYYFLEAK